MEQGIIDFYKERLKLQGADSETISPLLLAYIGDSLYDLAVREYMVMHFPGSVNAVNHRKTGFVCAHAQSEIMGYLIGQSLLTEEELSVYRRGRNQKSQTHSKNSSIQEYRRATGFEALLGYLYLSGQYERMIEVEAMGIEHLQSLMENERKVGE